MLALFRALPAMTLDQRQMITVLIDDFRQQVAKGRHPDGTEVAAQMPRWQMSDADLTDLFTYLKALSQ